MTDLNQQTQIARDFHRHTVYAIRTNEQGEPEFKMGDPPDLEDGIWQLDWNVVPFPYKVYESVSPIALPTEFPKPTISALEAISRIGNEPESNAVPTLATLAQIGLLGTGILKTGSHRPDGSVIEYRAAGGTGARYHLELYFICGALKDLDAGIYHYSAQDHTLRQLRAGDFRSHVIEATGGEPSTLHAPVIVAMTSTFWRNAWRYRARAYRHALWDAGTTFANVLAVASSHQLQSRMLFGFHDAAIHNLLGVDGTREAVLAMTTIGNHGSPLLRAPEITPLELQTRRISAYEVDFPWIGKMHTAGNLQSGADAAAWRAQPLVRDHQPAPAVPLQPQGELPDIDIQSLIHKRRSTRNYDTEVEISFAQFSTLLDRSIRGTDTDCLQSGSPPLFDHYLIVNAVESLEPGVYRVHEQSKSIELVKPGSFREDAQYLAANQEYCAHAHVNSYYLGQMEPVLERYGNRGYRVVQLMSALEGGKLHLMTHALGLGAVGSTSFDDAVTEFFAPGIDIDYLFVFVFGKRRKRAS